LLHKTQTILECFKKEKKQIIAVLSTQVSKGTTTQDLTQNSENILQCWLKNEVGKKTLTWKYDMRIIITEKS
jgi:hypothetical protein